MIYVVNLYAAICLSRLDQPSNGESKPPATLLVGPPGRMGAMVIYRP